MRLLSASLALVGLLIGAPLAAQDTISHPGASGHGVYTKGASVKPASACHVSNNNNSGAGSYRNCVEQDSVTVVFYGMTSCRPNLTTNVTTGDYVTIAGQTCQGDFIIRRQFGSQAIKIDNNDDVQIWYTVAVADSGSLNQDNCQIIGDSNNIYFAYSACWGHSDEAFDISPQANDTISNVSIERFAVGMSREERHSCWLMDDDNAGGELIKNVSVFQSAAIYCGNRNPWFAGHGVRFINFGSYNKSSRLVETPKNHADTVANVAPWVKNGPTSTSSSHSYLVQIKDNEPQGDSSGVYFPETSYSFGQKTDITESSWTLTYCELQSTGVDCAAGDTAKVALDSYPSHMLPGIEPPEFSAQAAYDSVITEGHIGRYRYMSCSGVWIEQTDSVSKTLIAHAKDSTHVSGFGGSDYPSNHEDYIDTWPPPVAAGDSACTNSDSDLLPDRFEVLTWGNTTTSDGSQDGDNDGFRDFTEYAWGTSPTDSTHLDGTEPTGDGFFIIYYKQLTVIASIILLIFIRMWIRRRLELMRQPRVFRAHQRVDMLTEHMETFDIDVSQVRERHET